MNRKESVIFIIMLLAAPISVIGADTYPVLPKKILSGYSGFWLNRNSVEQIVRIYLEPMHQAKFNSCEFKIFPTDLNLSDKKQLDKLRNLAIAIHKRKMIFMVYVYPNPYNGKRIYTNLPAFVDSSGKEHSERYSLAHWQVWRKVFDNAFQLARVSKELGISAVKLDIETIQNDEISYDDESWHKFIAYKKLVYKKSDALDKNTPAGERYSKLKQLNLLAEYKNWFRQQADVIAKEFEKQMHKINPNLSLGFMPAGGSRYALAFMKYWATPYAPAIIDSWCMYNGEGFNEKVLEEQNLVKSANKANLFIPWFRINSYRPEDITIQAYYAAMNTDGYSNWSMGMLNPNWDNQARPSVYRLPVNYTVEQYYRAYKKANELILQDISSGRNKPSAIAYRPVKPLPAPLNLGQVKIPHFKPIGSGTGQARWLTLRGQRVIYIYARKNEKISAYIKHLAGRKRMIALSAVILDKKYNIIAQTEILPSEGREIAAVAPQTGEYALVVTGGIDGQAWYSVKVRNKHIGLFAKPRAYFFYVKPFEIWVRRANIAGPAFVTLQTARNEIFAVSFNDSSAIIIRDTQKKRFEFPIGAECVRIRIFAPPTIPSGLYIQDIFISTGGSAEPFLFDNPERCISIYREQ